jgi:hypothetical protein
MIADAHRRGWSARLVQPDRPGEQDMPPSFDRVGQMLGLDYRCGVSDSQRKMAQLFGQDLGPFRVVEAGPFSKEGQGLGTP